MPLDWTREAISPDTCQVKHSAGKRKPLPSESPSACEEASILFLHEGDWAPGTALRLATAARTGARAVVRALQESSVEVQDRIISDFEGKCLLALKDPHAANVLMHLVSNFEECKVEFVAKELLKANFDVATHQYGSQLICEMLNQRWTGQAAQVLLATVLSRGTELWRAAHANTIIQQVLIEGTEQQKQQVLQSLLADFQKSERKWIRVMTSPKNTGEVQSIFVLTTAVLECDKNEALTSALVQDADCLRGLLKRKYGPVLLRALLQLEGPLAEEVYTRLLYAYTAVSAEELRSALDRLIRPCTSCEDKKSLCVKCVRSTAATRQLILELHGPELWESLSGEAIAPIDP